MALAARQSNLDDYRTGKASFASYLARIGSTAELATVEMVPPSLVPGTRPTVKEPYFSPSQLRTYRRCSAMYWFQYPNGRKSRTSSAQIFGSATHAAAETYFKARQGGLKAQDDAPELVAIATATAMSFLDEACSDDVDYGARWWQGPIDTPATLKLDVARGVRTLAARSWQHIVPEATEQGYLIRWRDGGLPLLAYLDVVGRWVPGGVVDRGTWMIDFKTGAKKDDATARLDVGLTAYCLGYELQTGRRTDGAALHTLVRTREPYVLIGESERDLASFKRLRMVAKLTEDQIRDGYYAPVDDDKTCSWCSFRTECDGQFGGAPAPKREEFDENAVPF